MRSIVYILFGLIVMVSSCGQQGAGLHYQNEKLSDSTVQFSLPPSSMIGSLDIRIGNHSNNPKSFYITPLGYDFGSYQKLVNSIVDSTMNDELKAYRLWNFMCEYTTHSVPAMQERLPHDPLRLVNSFYSGLCDDRNAALAKLFSLAGLKSRVYHLEGHVVAEAYYDKAWHMYDADWAVYWTEGDKVADVAYISQHPEVIKLGENYTPLVRNYIGPAILKYVYTSVENNRVNTWYDEVSLDYNNETRLQKGDELLLHVENLAWEGKLRKLVGEHTIADTRHWGYLKRNIHIQGGGYVFSESSPYAIEEISVNASAQAQAIWVYYSNDEVNWQLKGMLGGGNANLTFIPTDANSEDKVFEYKLKFVPLQGMLAIQDYTIRNAILFSPQVLLNSGKGFEVVPVAGEGELEVDLQMSFFTSKAH